VDNEKIKQGEPYEQILSQTANLDEILLQIALASETKTAVAPADFMSETMRRERGLAEIQAFLEWNRRQGAKSAEATGMEKMIVAAIQNNVQTEAIESMRKIAGVTDDRLIELKQRAKSSQ